MLATLSVIKMTAAKAGRVKAGAVPQKAALGNTQKCLRTCMAFAIILLQLNEKRTVPLHCARHKGKAGKRGNGCKSRAISSL